MVCDELLSGAVCRRSRQSDLGERGGVSPPIPSSRNRGTDAAPFACACASAGPIRRRGSKLGLAWLWACLLLAGGFLWNGLPAPSPSSQPLIAASSSRPAPVVAKYLTKPIREICVGDRVLAHNPEVSDSERADAIEPDPETWRHIRLSMQKPDGSDLQIEMLRPAEWLADHAISQIDLETPGWFVREQLLLDSSRWEEGLVGRTIELDLPELGAAGPAKVLSVQPCPVIESTSDDGRQVVTATFQHSSARVLDLYIDGEPKPIGVTANHPFWSEERQAFVPAGELTEGEKLRRADETITQITRITPRRGPPVAVYNFEVNSEHVYFVGQDGALVHNAYSSTARYLVYRGYDAAGALKYVGITSNWTARAAAHARNGIEIVRVPGLSGVGYRQARALEHLLIERYGLLRNGGILNQIQSGIASGSMWKYTQQQWQWAAGALRNIPW